MIRNGKNKKILARCSERERRFLGLILQKGNFVLTLKTLACTKQLFFCQNLKYEGDSKDSDIDIQTYMDSSSSRIDGLLKLAEVGENNCPENPDEETKGCKDMSNEILSGTSLPTSTRKADSEKGNRLYY